jgi:hypothetical protein
LAKHFRQVGNPNLPARQSSEIVPARRPIRPSAEAFNELELGAREKGVLVCAIYANPSHSRAQVCHEALEARWTVGRRDVGGELCLIICLHPGVILLMVERLRFDQTPKIGGRPPASVGKDDLLHAGIGPGGGCILPGQYDARDAGRP